ncbi:MAG: Grx4 family monothiol glutaredoxin [Alphaproteobacteria bacterium]
MDNTTKERIETEIAKSDIVLFMKGNPIFPQCGFSANTAGVLNHLGVEYHSVDVLADPDIREGIKVYTNWPTIPQVYVKGEFIGGCDIVKDMFETGELAELLQSRGINVQPAA